MKIKMVFFDCDGTLIEGNLWPNLETAVGIRPLVRGWLDDFYSGRMLFTQLIDNLSVAYRGKLTKKQFEEIMSVFTIFPDAREITAFLKEKNIPMAVISSGADYYVSRVAQELGISISRSNTIMKFDEHGDFVTFEHVEIDSLAKVSQIKEICQEQKILPEETIFVGDSYNDIGAFQLTKHGVLYKNTKKELTQHCWKWIDNLNQIRDLLEV